MKHLKRGRQERQIGLTPLIDVVFLLLIFFMVSSTFIRESQVKIDLPEASGEVREEQSQVVEITVDRRGEYAVNGRILVNAELTTLLRALREIQSSAAAVNPEKRVIITADANAAHQAVVRAMDAAGKVGLTRMSITTQQSEDEG